MLSEAKTKQLDEILSKHDYDEHQVIAIMQDIQKEYHYLPKETLTYVSKALKISEAKIYGVATFYENFSLEPKGKYVIKVCDGTACHVRNSVSILDAFKAELKLEAGQKTTADGIFTLETVSCLGACGLAPVCTVNDVVYPAMTSDKVKAIITQIKEKEAN